MYTKYEIQKIKWKFLKLNSKSKKLNWIKKNLKCLKKKNVDIALICVQPINQSTIELKYIQQIEEPSLITKQQCCELKTVGCGY